jgi:hypothetical protein
MSQGAGIPPAVSMGASLIFGSASLLLASPLLWRPRGQSLAAVSRTIQLPLSGVRSSPSPLLLQPLDLTGQI